MIIKAEGISKTYPRKSAEANYFYAVKETSLELKEGTLSVILGRSGSGKSTLLNMISGLLMPSSGKVLYDDTDIYSLNDKELSVFRNKKYRYDSAGSIGTSKSHCYGECYSAVYALQKK